MPCRTLTVAALLAAPAVLSAHGVNLTVRDDGSRIETVAEFGDGTPARDCAVKLRSADPVRVIVKGRTDDAGRWSFDRPEPGVYEVVVSDDAGHRAKAQLIVPGDGGAITAGDEVSPGERRRNWWIGVGLFAGMAVLGLTFWLRSRRA